MKSKAPLLLMEQMVMLLVFALAAALCVQAFVKSDAISARGEARDQAVIAAQSAAEMIRLGGGSPEKALRGAADELSGSISEDGALRLYYDAEWHPTPDASDENGYCLMAEPSAEQEPGLSQVTLTVSSPEEALVSFTIAWQSPLDGN